MKRKKIFTAILIIVSFIFSASFAKAATTDATLFFDQSAPPSVDVGADFNLVARINPGSNTAAGVNAIELHISYDPKVLQINTNGITWPSFFTVFQAPNIDNSVGTASIIVMTPIDVKSQADVAIFSFHALAAGNALVAFTNASDAAVNDGSGTLVVSTRTPTSETVLGAMNAVPTANLETPIYRFWSDQKQGHFYTDSIDEKNSIIATYPENVWRYEGQAYSAYASPVNGLVPVYRFWSDDKQHHFYTASEDEKNSVIENYPSHVWKYEGIAFYAYVSEQPKTTAVYRFWSDTKQGHFYTSTVTEKDQIIATYPENVWKLEGIAWYVPTSN